MTDHIARIYEVICAARCRWPDRRLAVCLGQREYDALMATLRACFEGEPRKRPSGELTTFLGYPLLVSDVPHGIRVTPEEGP